MAKHTNLAKVAAKSAEDANGPRALSRLESTVLGLLKDKKVEEQPYVNLKYYKPDYQCFSSWMPDELKAFSQFCLKLRKMKWPEIYKTGGSAGNKTGLGYTVHDNLKVLPDQPALKDISQDLTWFELRVDLKLRVHGFRATDAFFLVFLDREHAIYKG